MATKHFRPLLLGPVHLLTINFRLILLFGNGYKLANMPLAKDLLHPTSEEEKRSHKKKRLVQSPNSYFMDVKCPGCYKITTVFSHAQTVVLCVGCSTVLCQPTGGKARLTEDRCASSWSLTFTAAPWTDEADTGGMC
uniref:40S ribosomal protein S27 n=1 Tax=Oncorhynchus kisutch TaxID=8019 RepID=A0A8C7K4H3_ONCKI